MLSGQKYQKVVSYITGDLFFEAVYSFFI